MPTWETEGELMAPSLDSTKVAKSKEVGMPMLLEELAIDVLSEPLFSSTMAFWLFASDP